MKIVTFGDINKEIKGYGFSYSIKDFSKQLAIIFLGVLGAGFFFGLNIALIIFCTLFMLFLMPYVYKAQFKFLYEAKRFDDAVLYMTQMISCFKKSNKILLALKETREVVSDEIGLYIEEAIAYIEEGEYNKDLYREALSIIEEKYGCGRMKSLHDFISKVERSGGEYEKALNILDNDIEEWASRTYLYQKDRANVRTKINLAIVLAFVICAISKYMIPSQFDFTDNITYQIVTTFTICAMCLFYTIVQSVVIGSWLDTTSSNTKQIDSDYKKIDSYDVAKGKVKMLPVALVLVGVGIYMALLKEYVVGAACVVGAYVLYTQPARKIKVAKKRLEREIIKVFPDWLRGLSISIQTKTVRVAIQDSLYEAPYILQPYIANMVRRFETDFSITPYKEFITDFEIKEIGSAMRSLYAFNKTSKEETEQQLNGLIKRNNEMLAKAETIRNEDVTGICGFLVILPMIIGCVKLIVDMVLMLAQFVSQMNAF